jgi:RND family efflux transporter MFP subunit
VKQADSEVKLAEANVTFAAQSYKRWAAAAPEGAVSAQDRDQKTAELDTSEAKRDAAKAARDLAQAEVQRLETLAKFKEVKAPFDGVVTQRHVDLGDLVTAGSTSSTTPLFSIAQSKQVRVFVDVPQAASQEIHVRMPAAVMERGNGRTFPGSVSRTADSIDPQSRTLRVEVLVENPKGELKPGMYVDVSFKTDRTSPPLEIPAAALTMRTTGPHVAVVDGGGKVTFQKIEIGRDMGDVIEVTSGLKDGDVVAMNINSEVLDGERVAMHSADAPVAKPDEHPAAKPAVAELKTSSARARVAAAHTDGEHPAANPPH